MFILYLIGVVIVGLVFTFVVVYNDLIKSYEVDSAIYWGLILSLIWPVLLPAGAIFAMVVGPVLGVIKLASYFRDKKAKKAD